jgi:hypothetical protein
MTRKRAASSARQKTLPAWLSPSATNLRGSLRRLEPFLDQTCESWLRCTHDEHAALLRAWRQAYPGNVLTYARGKRGTRAFAEQENVNANHWCSRRRSFSQAASSFSLRSWLSFLSVSSVTGISGGHVSPPLKRFVGIPSKDPFDGATDCVPRTHAFRRAPIGPAAATCRRPFGARSNQPFSTSQERGRWVAAALHLPAEGIVSWRIVLCAKPPLT